MWQEAVQWRQPTSVEWPSPSHPAVFDRAAERIEREARDRWQLDVHQVEALAHADDLAEQNELATATPVTDSQPTEVTAAPMKAEVTTHLRGADVYSDEWLTPMFPRRQSRPGCLPTPLKRAR